MALVNYSSDSGSEEKEGDPTVMAATAVRKTIPSQQQTSALPPLPAAFHNLYASTVRPSTRDDPALHQGRRRQIPHVAGNWPSHIYIEWYPSPEEYELLNSLVSALRSGLNLGSPPKPEAVEGDGCESEPGLHTFLTSDLGTPLPLHISLSRPFVLATEEKDVFLERLTATIQRGSGVTRFAVNPNTLSWHRPPDSNRAFLVLRVQQKHNGVSPGDSIVATSSNRGLCNLLARCNDLVGEFGQPALYSDPREGEESAAAVAAAPPLADPSSASTAVNGKFHISIAWSFADVTLDLRSHTAAIYGSLPGLEEQVQRMQIPVESVKVKIGNIVTSLALPEKGRRACSGAGVTSLFGL